VQVFVAPGGRRVQLTLIDSPAETAIYRVRGMAGGDSTEFDALTQRLSRSVSLATDKAISDDAGAAEGSHRQAVSGSTSPVIGSARPGLGALTPWKSTGGLPTSPDGAASPGSDLERSHTVGETHRRRLAGDKVRVPALE